MIYELTEILRELKRIDTKLEKDAFAEGEIEEEIERVSEFPELQRKIRECASALEQADVNDVRKILSILHELDATLGTCVGHINSVQDAIVQLLRQLPSLEGEDD